MSLCNVCRLGRVQIPCAGVPEIETIDSVLQSLIRTSDGIRLIDFEFFGLGDACLHIVLISFQTDETGFDRLV